MSNKQFENNVEMANNGKNGLVDLNKHVDAVRFFRSKNQQDTIEHILVNEFYHNREYEITNKAPKIFIPDLAILDYKKPEKAVLSLIKKGVVKLLNDDNTIELVTDQVYCNQCRTRPVFIWDKINHLETFHSWRDYYFKNHVAELEFNNKPYPEMIDHDYKAIGELKDNTIEVKCKNCGYERTIYIDNRKECDPYDKGIFIMNPADKTDIHVRIGRNSTVTVLKNQEELQKFIQSKIEELN